MEAFLHLCSHNVPSDGLKWSILHNLDKDWGVAGIGVWLSRLRLHTTASNLKYIWPACTKSSCLCWKQLLASASSPHWHCGSLPTGCKSLNIFALKMILSNVTDSNTVDWNLACSKQYVHVLWDCTQENTPYRLVSIDKELAATQPLGFCVSAFGQRKEKTWKPNLALFLWFHL